MTGQIIHALGSANFTAYDYHQILIPNGVAATIYGTVLPSMGAPTILDLGISNSTQAAGSIFLIGRKKFGATSGTTGTWENALSNDPGNSAGTYSIK